MKIKDIMFEAFDPNKEYPDTETGAKECFTDISNYKPEDITKVYPDPQVDHVWAIHTKTKEHGPQKHVVWLKDHDFATDDRSGDEDFKINENASAGATSAGAIASVNTVLGGGNLIRRSIYSTPKKKKKNIENK